MFVLSCELRVCLPISKPVVVTIVLGFDFVRFQCCCDTCCVLTKQHAHVSRLSYHRHFYKFKQSSLYIKTGRPIVQKHGYLLKHFSIKIAFHGPFHTEKVLVLSECGFESRPGRSRRLCPWARHLTITASSFGWDVKL